LDDSLPFYSRYYAVMLEFETYYSATPQKPLWVKAYSEHTTMLKTSKIVNDPEQQLNEQLRKYFGYRKTVKIVQVRYRKTVKIVQVRYRKTVKIVQVRYRKTVKIVQVRYRKTVK
jgi:hypothetical protein